MRDAIICDIDGTLADVEHRRHFVDGSNGKKDFNAFYEAMGDDGVHEDIVDLVRFYAFDGHHILLCTGRPEEYRDITRRWLSDHRISCDELHMRPDEHRHLPDYVIKRGMLDTLKNLYNITLAIDDRNQVVKMWRSNGIRCLQVADGDF